MAWCCYLSALSAFKSPPLQPLRLSSAGRPGFSLQACGAAEGGGSHSSRSVPTPASLAASRQRATSFSNLSFRSDSRIRKNRVASSCRCSSRSCSQSLFMCLLESLRVLVCAVLCMNTRFLCVSVCMGVLVALVWRSQSLLVPVLLSRLLCHSGSTEMSGLSIYLTFKEGSGISNSVP